MIFWIECELRCKIFWKVWKQFGLSESAGMRWSVVHVPCKFISWWRETIGPGKRGYTVADTLLPMMFLGLGKLSGKHLLWTQNVPEQNQKHFCVPDTKFVPATDVARKRGNICVGNYVSATISPRLSGPYENWNSIYFCGHEIPLAAVFAISRSKMFLLLTKMFEQQT